MNGSTQKIVKAALAADDNITTDQMKAAIAVLNGRVPQQGPLPLLLSQKQTAFLLGVSRFTIRRMTEGGRLHPIKVHEAFRYRRAEIEKIAGGPASEPCSAKIGSED